MVSTPEIEEELPRAVRNILESRHSDMPLDQRQADTLSEVKTWCAEYEEVGLWEYIPAPTLPEPSEQEDIVMAIGELWGRYVTDPDDLHLARAVVRYRLDALITTNLTLVGADDWSEMMHNLAPDRPPTLCQKEKIIDWTLGQDQISLDPEEMTKCLLSTLPPSDKLKDRVNGWIRYLRAPFPKMARLTEDYLQRITPESLRQLHEQALADHLTPTTQRVMQYPNP